MSKKIIVIPCYNEEDRLARSAVAELLQEEGMHLLLVDDGSSDGTEMLIERYSRELPRVTTLILEKNCGKGEAVRQGMMKALADGAAIVGYVDADFSTPPKEIIRLLRQLEGSEKKVLFAARVQLLGLSIHRKSFRHYTGRIFATLASLVLALPVYDTQCGAKFFRDTPSMRAALDHPFCSRWAFDVELLARLSHGSKESPALAVEDFSEVPLLVWHEIAGSKVRFWHSFQMALDLLKIYFMRQ